MLENPFYVIQHSRVDLWVPSPHKCHFKLSQPSWLSQRNDSLKVDSPIHNGKLGPEGGGSEDRRER